MRKNNKCFEKKKLCAISAVLLCLSASLCITCFCLSNNTSAVSSYESQVAEIMRNYFESPSDAREKLLLIDTVLLAEPSSNESPAPYTLTAYIFKKNDSPICFLQWMLTSSKSEFFCGPLDMVRVEWSGEYASYYLSEGDGNISTVKSREYDAVCFNVEDDKLNKGKYSYGTLSLTPEMPGTLDFTCKYVHTYLNYFTDGFSPSSLDILRRSEMQISSTAYIP